MVKFDFFTFEESQTELTLRQAFGLESSVGALCEWVAAKFHTRFVTLWAANGAGTNVLFP